MTTREPMPDGDITAEKSWRSVTALVLITVGYVLLNSLVVRVFPSVPCSPVAPADCIPEPTTGQLLVTGLLPLVAAALALIQLPILWQQTKLLGSQIRWGLRLLGLGMWLWLVARGVTAIGAIISRFMS